MQPSLRLHLMAIDFDLLPTLSEALGLLPNVKPRNAYRLVMEVREDLLMQKLPRRLRGRGKPRARCFVTVHAGNFVVGQREPGVQIGLGDLEGALASRLQGDPERVTPEGAALLVRMYQEGAFELRQKSDRIETPIALKEFASSRADLEAATERRRNQPQEAHSAEEALVSNPSQVSEDQFTWILLNSIFVRRHGYGHGHREMEIGGIRVTKSVTAYSSNTGKSRDFEVTFSWTGTGGEKHFRSRESHYKENRRNDAGRNWGLGSV